jgi:hypothetical protein
MKDKHTLRTLYGDKLQTIEIDGVENEILDPDVFIDSFKELGISFLDELEIE